MGPEGGDEIVAAGTLEDVVGEKRGHTGQFLKPMLGREATARKKGQQAAE